MHLGVGDFVILTFPKRDPFRECRFRRVLWFQPNY